MGQPLYFGIGCYHFGIRENPPSKLTGEDYVKELNRTLQSLSNINNVEIECDEEFKSSLIDTSMGLPNIESGEGFCPSPTYCYIAYEVFIPQRIQVELRSPSFFKLETFTEYFRVSMHYPYHLPVAFIEPVNPTEKCSPSDAVQIVRKFLEQEFNNNNASSLLRFVSLGPSPFHADCCIQCGEEKHPETKWRYKAIRHQKLAYDEVVFLYNPHVYRDVEEAKEEIFEDIARELGLFYELVQQEAGIMHTWDEIEEMVNNLVLIQRERGVKGIAKRFLKRSQILNELVTSLVQFGSNQHFLNAMAQRDYKNIYSTGEDSPFKPFLDKELRETYFYPIEEISKLITFVESRRAKGVEYLILLTSTILGGAIGALLTIAFSQK